MTYVKITPGDAVLFTYRFEDGRQRIVTGICSEIQNRGETFYVEQVIPITEEGKLRFTGSAPPYVTDRITAIKKVCTGDDLEEVVSMASKGKLRQAGEPIEMPKTPLILTDDERLARSIQQLEGLRVRPYSALLRAGYHTVGDVAEQKPEELLKVKNLGRKGLRNIVAVLHQFGVSLAPTKYPDKYAEFYMGE